MTDAFLPDQVALELPPAASTVDLVSDYLRRVVQRGELGPGDKLPAERQLAVALGVGRVTLRESLQALEDEGFIVRRRGVSGGAFITDLGRPFATWQATVTADRAALDELFDLREAAEVQIALLAATRRTAAHVRELRHAVHELRGATSRADFRRWDLRFHGQLADASRSARLTALMHSVRGELFSPVEPTVVAARVQQAADGHEAIVDAVHAKDAELAAATMRSHLRTARAETLKALGLR